MTGPRVKHALILAAGQGGRMGDLGLFMPKALAPVANRPLLVRHLELLAAQGVQVVHIIVGHLGHLIVDALAAQPVAGLQVEFHVQQERLGLGHAVLQAETFLSSTPFVLILADIAFALTDPAPLFTLPEGVAGRVAVKMEQDVEPIKRNFSVIHDDTGRITQVIEKPQNPPNMLKGTGQYAFTPQIFEAIHRTPRSALKNEYELTDAIQTLIDTGGLVEVADVISWDLNLTFPSDLLVCNRHFLSDVATDELIKSEMPQGSVITNSVVGPDVTTDGPVDLDNCVVLAGSHLSGGVPLRNTVVAPNGMWREH